MKLKSFFAVKETITRVMSQPPEQERLLSLLHIKQRIMSRIYKEQQSLKIKLKLNYPVKNGQLLNRWFSKEGIKMTHKYLKKRP